MTQELSSNLVCIFIRSGQEIWLELERAKNLIALLKSPNAPQFIEYDDYLFNKSDIVGIFPASAMEKLAQRKQGYFKCQGCGQLLPKGKECGNCMGF